MEQALANARPRHWLWRPYLTVFISSTCIMVLELAGQRIIAPHVGSSLYTWTSVIGVVMAGISMGNALGGRLAARYASLRLLGLMFLCAGVAGWLVLPLDAWNPLGALAIPLLPKVVLVMALLFLLPCTILGMISPLVAQLATRDLARAGRTVGSLYAVATAGSIVGTVVTGFYLIARFRVDHIILGAGAALVLWVGPLSEQALVVLCGR